MSQLQSLNEILPNHEKGIAIQMKTLHHSVIVLKHDFYESLVRSIDDGYVFPRWSVKRCVWKIKLIISFNVMLVS